MKIKMKKSSLPMMTGLGPSAWDRDGEKMSMHPPLPGHIEYVEEEMEMHEHANEHHIVHRRHPENDSEEKMISKEISVDDLDKQQHRHHAGHHSKKHDK